MSTVTDQRTTGPIGELAAFLRNERANHCRQWVEEALRLPQWAKEHADENARSALAQRATQFYDSLIARLEQPDAAIGGEGLPAMARSYYGKGVGPDELVRVIISLKRLVIRGLVNRYAADKAALAAMCGRYEDEIDAARMRASLLYHEIDVAKYQESEAKVKLHAAMNRTMAAVIAATSPNQVAEGLFTHLREFLRYDAVLFGLLAGDGTQVECVCALEKESSVEAVDAGERQRFVMAECIARNEPIILADTMADPSPDRYPILRKRGIRSALLVPLQARNAVVGALLLGCFEPNVYREADKETLANIAAEISLPIQNMVLLGTEQKRTAELSMVNAVSRAVTGHLETRNMLQAAARAIQGTFAYYDVSFFLVDRATNSLVMTAQAGAFGELMEVGYRQVIGVGMVGWTAQHGQTLIANDVTKEPRRIIAFAGEAECKSEMTVPIKVGDNVVGVINVSSRRVGAFDQRDRIALETIAQEVAKGFESARLYNETRTLKEQSDHLVSSIPLSLLLLDRDLRVVRFNPASLANLGVSETALMGRQIRDLIAEDPESSVFHQSTRQAVEGGKLTSFAGLTVKLANLGERVFNVWFSPTQAHSEGVGLLVLQDITQESRTEEEMRRVRKQLQAIMTYLPVGITSTDMNGLYTYWSSGCERIFGYTAEEVLGKQTPVALAKEPYDLAAELELCKRQGFTESERINVRKDGTEIWVHKVRVNLYDESGKQIGFVSYLQDVTQRRRAQEEVLREKQKLSEVVGAMGAGLALMDLNRKITWANKTLHDWLGSGHTIIGRDCFEVFHAGKAHCENCISDLAIATGRVQKHQYAATTRDGVHRHFQHIVAPIRDREGKTSQLLVMTLEITEHVDRVNQIEMLQQLSEQLQGVVEFDRLLYLILTCVTAGEALGFNRAALLLVDRERGVLQGRMGVGPSSAEEAGRIWSQIQTEKKTLEDFMDEYDQMSDEEQEALKAAVRTMRFPLTDTNELPVACLLRKECILVTDGSDGRASASLRRMVGTDQFVIVPLVARAEALGVLIADNRFSRQPITESSMRLLRTFANQAALSIANAAAYHKLEENVRQLAEARDRIVRSERLAAVGGMAAHVAHEIRNPLVTIGGFARSILRGADPATPCGQHSRIIVDEVMRLEKILANVMNFTKPTPPRRAEAGVEQILDQTCVMLAEACKSKNVALVKEFRLNNEKTLLDAGQIKQVFLNVIQNAVDSIESSGRVTVRTSANEDRIRIDITDTGVGMPPEVQQNIFLPFFTTKPDGTGLGLAVSRKIVEDHGGEMQVQSAVGIGTTFSIFLPRTNPAPS